MNLMKLSLGARQTVARLFSVCLLRDFSIFTVLKKQTHGRHASGVDDDVPFPHLRSWSPLWGGMLEAMQCCQAVCNGMLPDRSVSAAQTCQACKTTLPLGRTEHWEYLLTANP